MNSMIVDKIQSKETSERVLKKMKLNEDSHD